MTVVIVQCRLSSTRLPGKALKDLGGKPILAWVLAVMRKVKADAYYVATDETSFEALSPVAAACGWQIFAGPLDDVLKRFCLLIDKIGADIVVRATADNPFLFYEAAEALLDEFLRRKTFSKCDYITWTGLPHGSGIEIFDAHSLLEAERLTSEPYDREHVGPALYNHRERFSPLMLKAPSRFYYPELRTTIDTPRDYRKALQAIDLLSNGTASDEPYTTEQIVKAFSSPCMAHPILYVPSVKAGRGTGHLRRCLASARESSASVYISPDADLQEYETLVKASGLRDWQIVRDEPQKDEWTLIVADAFSLDKNEARRLHECAVLVAIDEGSENTAFCDILIDIVPSGLTRAANITNADFIKMPINKKNVEDETKPPRTALVCMGGEDPAALTIPAALALIQAGLDVSAIIPNGVDARKIKDAGVHCLGEIPELREKLFEYDLIVTHYGLTAYEARGANCAVFLLATSPLHARLAKKYGFVCFEKKELTKANIETLLLKPEKLYSKINNFAVGNVHGAANNDVRNAINDNTRDSEKKSLGTFISSLALGMRISCPACGSSDAEKNKIVARTTRRTFRRCGTCGMLYVSWTLDGKGSDYGASYFDEEYKAQYGKSYLEDFSAIRVGGIRRIRVVDSLAKKCRRNKSKPMLLDIGCAYGPFLAAADEDGWQVYGTDVSDAAVDYVQKTLLFPVSRAHFPDFNAAQEFGVYEFDAVTMWYVIEHFVDLKSVLKTVSRLVKQGGVFAFSTPSGEGVSAKYNTQQFFNKSPKDHYSVFEPSRAGQLLKRFGFKVEKIISTGHHAERFPQVKKRGWKKGSSMYAFYENMSRLRKLGDTFEVYCRKS